MWQYDPPIMNRTHHLELRESETAVLVILHEACCISEVWYSNFIGVMATSRGVVVRVGEESYLTSYGCGETIDGLLERVGQTLGVSNDSTRLFVLGDLEEDQTSTLPKNPEVVINITEDLNSKIPWVSSLFSEVDSMILHLRPSIKSLMARKVVLEYIKKNLSKCLGARVFCIGSSMNNIFLPNETIEVTPFLCKGFPNRSPPSYFP